MATLFASEIPLPSFPDRTVSIADYGATSGGGVLNTEAFGRAIAACVTAGGGKVVVPPGIWLTGPIRLESNINLHVEAGALVLFSPSFEDYPLIRTTFEGHERVRCMAPLYGSQLQNVAITGKGIFDGSGHAWRPVKRFKLTERQWKKLVSSGGIVDGANQVWWPSEGAMRGQELIADLERRGDAVLPEEYAAAREYLRPVLLSLETCRGVLLDGPTFQNSPAWNIHPLLCEDMIIQNVTVRNPWYSQNGDGLDLESCRNVVVRNSSFDVGDDAICLKSGKDEAGRKRWRPCEAISVTHCTVYHGHGGFTIGSEMSGGVRNVEVANCTFVGTDVGLRFKSKRGRGGVVENIYISAINMINIADEAILLDMFYEQKGATGDAERVEPVSEGTPIFKDIYMRNIVCRGAGRAMTVRGLPEMPIKGVRVEDTVLEARSGLSCSYVENLQLRKVAIAVKGSPH